MRNLSRGMESGSRSISYLLVNYRKLYQPVSAIVSVLKEQAERKLDLILFDSVQVAKPPLIAFGGKYLKHKNNIRLRIAYTSYRAYVW